MNILGMDIGTSGCKALLFNEEGKLLKTTHREYAVDIPHPTWAEQDIQNVWRLAKEAVLELLTSLSLREIQAISLSVHGEAVTPIDQHGNPMRPTILGMDTRTSQQNKILSDQFGARALFERTGMPVHTVNTLPKLLWIKQHEPEIWKKADQFLLVEDFFIRKMTGAALTSKCLASRTQLFNLQDDTWDKDILTFLELDENRLPKIQESGTAAGELCQELCDYWGLLRKPLVVSGGHDQACGALGAGLIKAGLASVSTGTAEVVEVALPSPNISLPLYKGNISVYHHVVPELYLAMTLNHSGGLALRWFRDGFCEPQVLQANSNNQDAYDLIFDEASADPSGLLVLPHFSGSGTPTFDTFSKAAILGMTISTKRSEIAKAILEGLTYELRMNLELLKAGGVQIDVLRAIGGGAKSKRWLQLKADITGIPVLAPQITEAAGFGAALLAGVGAGIFSSAAQASEQFIQISSEYYPNPNRNAAFSKMYDLYRQVYPAISSIHHQL